MNLPLLTNIITWQQFKDGGARVQAHNGCHGRENEVRFYIEFNAQSVRLIKLNLGISNYETDCTDKLRSRGISLFLGIFLR